MPKLTSVLLTVFILTGCTNQNTAPGNSQSSDTTKIAKTKQTVTGSPIDTAFKPDFFKAVPNTTDRYGEYVTYDTSKTTNDRYVFLLNFTDFALIKINGKDIYLYRDTTESKKLDDKSDIAVCKGQGYKAILKVKQTKTYDEGGCYSGTLQILGDKLNATFKVHGEAGC